MTKRERVIEAINHKETDIIPYNIDFTSIELEKCIKDSGNINFYNDIGCHISTSGLWYYKEIEKNLFLDEFGVVWDKTKDKDIGCVVGKKIEDIENYNYIFPEVNYKLGADSINSMLKNGGDTFKIFGISFSLFERAWTLLGMENLLMDMITNEKEVKELFEKITKYNLAAIDFALQYDEIDAIMFGDDWGQQKGLIMGVKHWRNFVKPYLERMYRKVKKSGKYVFQHSCGDISEIFGDLVDIGLDVYQTFQPEIYDIDKVKEIWGDKLTFWGGISTQHVLPYGTTQEVEDVTIKTMRVLGKGGGYIASPTHSIPKDTPSENVFSMLNVFQNQKIFME